MSLLSSLLDDKRKTQTPLILVQYSAAQSALAILRSIINCRQENAVILVCTLYQPSDLVLAPESATVLDWTAEVPGYFDGAIDWQVRLEAIKSAIAGALVYNHRSVHL